MGKYTIGMNEKLCHLTGRSFSLRPRSGYCQLPFGQLSSPPRQRLKNKNLIRIFYAVTQRGPVFDQIALQKNIDMLAKTARFIGQVIVDAGVAGFYLVEHIAYGAPFQLQIRERWKEGFEGGCEFYFCHGVFETLVYAHRLKPYMFELSSQLKRKKFNKIRKKKLDTAY